MLSSVKDHVMNKPTSPGLNGKIALVTGGGRGIGKAIAGRLAAAGANVVIASRKCEVLEATAIEFAAAGLTGHVVAIPCHVGQADQVVALVRTIEERLGPVDVLVNNSATNVGQGPALAVTDDQFDKIMEINVKAALRLVKAIVPGMIERGGGSVINVVSIAGLQPMTGGLLYSASKAALIMITRAWAREFGPSGVRVNAIAPGLIQTDFSAYFWQDEARRDSMISGQSLRRLGQPEDVAGLALFLASDESAFVTGQILVVDGGATG